ncbi:MAG: trigger factor [Bdellovibrionales bacterium CG12_big_fil_rev_8_21_14_0_65_38_15]|nr:MAG: trigger factor [Bdellovibrionales bacterium CG22_combo_CG10-13_8_21_14_all_38_13]PIQ53958.1 MAG: trigger factor [Bdellovibrionales bacterium CG12_big_fil_rev_8_21_14_0_65_38_15]PIR30998.1 MAG: trigger factor [Bdellovibrionales bacterium CG11_big_fil_rev_8_21_14_0_20_38_13]
MSYQLQAVNDCTKKLVFNFETLDLTTEIKAAVVKKQKSTNLKGFRKGKAPLAMVEQIYGPQLEGEALNSFVQNKVFEAITAEKLRVVGYPAFENMKYEAGKSVSFEAVVEIFPEIKLKDVSGLSFEMDSTAVNDEDLEQLKKNYLASKAEMTEMADASAKLTNGQFAVLNFQGVQENGERPENMKGEEFLLEIGSNQFIPGFEEGMVGMKKGEKKNIELTFPADYHMDALKNAKVTFETELLEIKERNFPELTDELAKEFGYADAAEFKTKNLDMLTKQKDRAAKEKLHQDILNKLIEENKFDVPKTMVEQQEQHVRDDISNNLKQQGFNDKMLSEYFSRWASDVTTKAEFQVKSGLILDTLAKDYKVEASESDLAAKIDEMAASSGLEKAKIEEYYLGNEKLKNNLMYAIREEKTFDQLRSKVKVKTK